MLQQIISGLGLVGDRSGESGDNTDNSDILNFSNKLRAFFFCQILLMGNILVATATVFHPNLRNAGNVVIVVASYRYDGLIFCDQGWS